MRNTILAISLLALTGTAAAAPSLIASVDSNRGVTFEFVADKSSPVAAFTIVLPLTPSKQRATVAENCLKAPQGFSALCNIDNNVFKAIVYSPSPDAVIPSGTLGRVVLPPGAVTMLKSGEISGLKLDAADSAAKSVIGEVLSEAATTGRTAPTRQN